ncbi:MAG TPA: hypothetical protein VGH28_26715, partial [Polyangiaceae bacterium]
MNSTIKTNNVTIPRSTAELAVPRAMKLLRTLGTDSVVLAAMKQTGFDIDDMKQGWSLVLKACSAPTVDAKFAPHTGPVADATQKIEAWQSTMFLRAHAALRRLHPAQDTFLFENLATGTGVAAVVAVSMFLERLDALESSADRKASRKADHAALATLEKRGVTKDERKQIHSLVQLVETTPAPAVVDVAPSPDVRMAALVELHAWVQDWSDCARAVITRRDQLLRLGIGKRRARAVAAPAPQPEPAPQPQPAPAPPALPEPAPAQV